jgi:ParB family transcriptional regulator, chromosome partitioning protein
VSHALEIVNLDAKEQKIINDAIIGENLTVQDIREITKHSKLSKTKRVRDKGIGQEDDSGYYTHPFDNITLDRHNDSIIQQTRLLQKAQLCLRISLYRLDTLIHECKDKLNANDHSEVSDILMQYRLRIHSMMDDNIRAIAKLKR